MVQAYSENAVLPGRGVPIPFDGLTTQLAEMLELPATDVQNAFWTMAVGALCAVCCSLSGCFLVLRRISLLGDALSHSVLAGTAGVYLVTGRVDPVPMLLGAMAAGMVTAVMTQFVHKAAQLPEDSSIGIVFTSLFAFGVVVVSQAKHVHLDLDCVLFGDLAFAGVNLHPVFGWLVPESFRSLVPTLMITLLLLAVFWKELRLTSFDPTLAVTLGFSATVMHYLLTTVVAIVTVSAMEVVGLLVVALLIVPAAIARLLTDRLSTMLVLSCLIGISCTTIGYLLALRWNSSAAGLTAVVAGAELLIAIVVSPRNGLLGRLIRTARLRVRICAEDVLAGLFRRQERSDAPDGLVQASVSECYALAGGGIMSMAALRWLLSRQLLQQAGSVMSLSETGLRYARSMVRSHRLWEAYLKENFNLPPDHLHDPAEDMEHFIGPGVQQQITEDLSQSAEDPHGRAIPDVKTQEVS
ncbi:MAG: iron ABC transporter [Fuerstiella sp.]|nr:iron ABC transporter [Fuerstiella sp.]MCP4507290.1 iron ABC transporter [Fuerstiella sp.]